MDLLGRLPGRNASARTVAATVTIRCISQLPINMADKFCAHDMPQLISMAAVWDDASDSTAVDGTPSFLITWRP